MESFYCIFSIEEVHHTKKHSYVMAATGGNTHVVRQASQGTSKGLQSNQERRLFGDGCTVVRVLSGIHFPSLRAQDTDSMKQMTLTFRHRLRYRPQTQEFQKYVSETSFENVSEITKNVSKTTKHVSETTSVVSELGPVVQSPIKLILG